MKNAVSLCVTDVQDKFAILSGISLMMCVAPLPGAKGSSSLSTACSINRHKNIEMRINQESNFLEVLKYHCFQGKSLGRGFYFQFYT